MEELTLVQKIAVSVIPLILAITLHEAAHGYVAGLLGDPTAKLLGRVTANPINHIDPFGTLLLPGVLLLFGSPILFGWAKPVPVAQNNLRRPRRDMGIVAFAGPGANILMALAWGILMKLLFVLGLQATLWFFVLMAQVGIFANLLLAVLNMMPVPPLDGGRILVALLPPAIGNTIARLEPYGLIILLVLLFYGELGSRVLLPGILAGSQFIYTILGL